MSTESNTLKENAERKYFRLVDIPVNSQTRTKLKKLKRELTYDQYILQLIKGNNQK